jgi:hypothetical protein
MGDKGSHSVQLEAVRANSICIMEMVQSLVVMMSKLNSEVHQIRVDNDTLKTQLRELQKAPSHVPSTRRDAASSAIANNATAKSYRDVVCAVGGNHSVTVVTAPPRNSLLEPSIVTGEKPSDGDVVTVVKKKRVTPSPANTAAVAITSKILRIAMIGVRSSSSLSVVQKRVRRKSLFVSRFFPWFYSI